MMTETLRRPTLQEIGKRATEIYDQIDDAIKKKYAGHFMVVNVKSGRHYIAEFSEEAFRLAREAETYGMFHLIRIGSPTAFRFTRSMGRTHDANWSWPL